MASTVKKVVLIFIWTMVVGVISVVLALAAYSDMEDEISEADLLR